MKKSTPQAVATSENQPSIRVIKTAICKSLSGKSDLTYHLGLDEESNLLLRVFANSGSGYFSQEWVPYSAIQSILAKLPFITSFSLRALYVGKSTNSPGFLLASLLNEKLVQTNPINERNYVAISPDLFVAEIKALMKSLPDSVADTPGIKKASGGKGSPNNKATSKAEISPLETKSACQSS